MLPNWRFSLGRVKIPLSPPTSSKRRPPRHRHRYLRHLRHRHLRHRPQARHLNFTCPARRLQHARNPVTVTVIVGKRARQIDFFEPCCICLVLATMGRGNLPTNARLAFVYPTPLLLGGRTHQCAHNTQPALRVAMRLQPVIVLVALQARPTISSFTSSHDDRQGPTSPPTPCPTQPNLQESKRECVLPRPRP